MPSYIELDKVSSLPSASSAGKVVFGINSSGEAVIINNAGSTNSYGTGSTGINYTNYTPILKETAPAAQTSGLLIVGETYVITNYVTPEEVGVPTDDFSNVADVISGTINTTGCVFKATGFKPTSWANASTLTSYGNPIVTSTLSNTFGFTPDWKYAFVGRYYFDFPSLINKDKVVVLPSERIPSFSRRVAGAASTLTEPSWSFVPTDGGDAPNNAVNSILVHSSGYIFVGGGFDAWGGVGPITLAKIDQDGNLVDSLLLIGGPIQKIVELADGSIIVGGNFTGCIKKYNVNLVEDSTFSSNIGTGFTWNGSTGNIQAIGQQSSGKIVVGGYFNELDGSSVQQSIVRLNLNGTLDSSFNNGATGDYGVRYGNQSVKAILIDIDDKIMVGGNFWEYNRTRGRMFVRLNSDGTYDSTFMTTILDNYYGMLNITVDDIALQDDGYILVGKFSGWNIGAVGVGTTVTRSHIIKIKKDGMEDPNFYFSIGGVNGTGFNDEVKTIAIQSNGDILVGGGFTTVDTDTTSYRIARLRSNGEIDTDFDSSTYGFDSVVNTIALNSNGEIFVGGDFSAYDTDGTGSPYIAKMINTSRCGLFSSNNKPEPADNLLLNTPIEVRLYN